MLTFHILGSLQIFGSDRAARLARHPKSVGVVAYLALQGRDGFVTRDRLCGLFWPESDPVRAPASLRQVLRGLREALPERVLHTRGKREVGLIDANVSCDACQLRDAYEAGDFERAWVLYRGDLLDGFHIEGAFEFMDWLDRQRRSTMEMAADAAWRMADQAAGRGQLHEASRWGKRAFALSPFDELQARRLMRLLFQVGDRPGALRVYGGLKERFLRDFGIGPSQQTEELIRSGLAGTSGARTEEMGGDRRSGGDRRLGVPRERLGEERRSGKERRSGEGDRRARRPPDHGRPGGRAP